MEIRYVTAEQVRAAIDATSSLYDENVTDKDGLSTFGKRVPGVRVGIRVSDSFGKGARRSWSDRHGPWACWHVIRDFCREIYKINPDAVISSGLGREGVKYQGTAHFENTFPDTYYTNAGSEWYPRYFGSLCDCSE